MTEEWDRRLEAVFERVDIKMEQHFKEVFPRRNNRPAHGETASSQMSGLFNIGASFSAGYGSEQGRGYVIDVELCTYHNVDSELKENIETYARELIKQELEQEFPGRKLEIMRDGGVYKITGDFFLGKA